MPRKRRRRAVGSGAADDCFTCAGRQVRCDRRRPYCTPCLEQDGRCSGYKTALTWGVGVASRGKLRGLALPVSGAQKVGTTTPTAAAKTPVTTAPPAPAQLPQCGPPEPPNTPGWPSHALPPTASPGLPVRAGSSAHHAQWPPPFTLHTHPHPHPHYTTPPSPSSSDLSLHLLTTPTSHYADGASFEPDDPRDRPPSDALAPALARYSYRSPPAYAPLVHQPPLNQIVGQTPRMRYLIGYYMEVIAPVIVAFDTPTSPFRLYMLELAKTSDTLQLAIAALSLSNLRQRRKNWALSTGKTLPSRRSCQAHCRLTDTAVADVYELPSPDEQMREEILYKGAVVKSINAQLADPIARRSDALLATLLILSIIHMCDTGFASFKSQFAGVRKLFALRKASRTAGSDVMKWFMRIFTWFDTMTAAVNDRDSELSAECLDVVTETGDQWSLENLSGCDSRLFRVVAQLSRLNQLSQMKPVEASDFVDRPIASATPPPQLLHYPGLAGPSDPRGDLLSFPVQAYFPGYESADPRTEFWLEWRALKVRLETWRLGVSDPAVLAAMTTGPLTPSSATGAAACPSPLVEHVASSLSPFARVAPANLSDIANISESFRYAGLLYLERLAHPQLPSSHLRIQSLVYAALHYLAAVQSDVFLLWPLFITGAECVLEADRNLIRERCGDIQKDSGFVNNLSCLQLLEKIWARESPAAVVVGGVKLEEQLAAPPPPRVPLGGEGFKWRAIIDSEKLIHEYIVV
ncbi:hypothetical protein LOZ60_001287 [Ophidiomyces ophidiicola]|nr:hypothetical protein LOZ60_001287 [Ophidiomyces ophidiicola]KAI2149702.1 hypothetical protein LOZ27_000857 [Ophidiomyces ophidiicola]